MHIKDKNIAILASLEQLIQNKRFEDLEKTQELLHVFVLKYEYYFPNNLESLIFDLVSMYNNFLDIKKEETPYFVVPDSVAKMMAGNNNGALKDLEAFDMPNCYMKEYLKAVIGARTAKENLLFDSLTEACKINSDMKAKAKTDMEFDKYFENAKFKAIVD